MPALSPSLYFYLLVGALQGLLLLSALWLEIPWISTMLVTLATVGGINLQLLGRSVLQRGTWVLVALMTLVMTAISGWVFSGNGSQWLQGSWVVCASLLGYIGCAFIASWPTREGRWPRYEDLFRHAWNNIFIVLLAQQLIMVVMLLVLLCGALFKMLGVPQVKAVLESPLFLAIALTLVFSLGMRIGREKETVIGLLRGVLLAVCRFLLPFGALMTVLFILTLPFSGLQPVWDTGSSTLILLCLVGLNLFLVNGVFQDGHDSAPYARGLRLLVELSLLCLPVLVVLAGYSTWLRIEQYGLTPQRFMAIPLLLVALLYSLAAVWAVVRRQSVWLGHLRTSNPPIALFGCVVLVLVHTPLVSPETWSAKHQVQRLLSGRTAVADFDAWTLRYRLGAPGIEQLEWLTAEVDRGQILDAQGREQLREILKEPTYRSNSAEFDGRDNALKIEWVGNTEDGVETMLKGAFIGMHCQGAGCVLHAMDLNDDGRNEVLLVSKEEWAFKAYILERDEHGEWRAAADLEGQDDPARVIELIRQGALKPVKPRFNTFNIDGVELSAVPTHD